MRILKGTKKAILSLYVASNENFLNTVWRLVQREIYNKAAETIRYAKFITEDNPFQRGTTWDSMFSPEAFSDTVSSYSLGVDAD